MVRTKEDIWEQSKEFLLKEYEECWRALIDTYHRNESWFKFHIAFLTLAGGIVGVSFRIGKLQQGLWLIFCVLLVALYLTGLAALYMFYKNRKIIVEYMNAINRIRKFFVERAQTIDAGFKEWVLLPIKPQKNFKPLSVNLIMIYIVCFLNFLILIGILLIYMKEIRWINVPLSNGLLFSMIKGSLIINSWILFLIIRSLVKADQRQRERPPLKLKPIRSEKC